MTRNSKIISGQWTDIDEESFLVVTEVTRRNLARFIISWDNESEEIVADLNEGQVTALVADLLEWLQERQRGRSS